MFNKVEFSDLYKFLTSIGLVIIAAAFIIPWLFMRQDMSIVLSAEDYNQLADSSKELTDKRISLNTRVVNTLPWLSLTLLMIGSAIIGFGISKWKKKQDVVDESEKLKLAKLRAEVEPLEPSEIQDKANNEIEEEINAISDISEIAELKKESGAVNVTINKTLMRTNLLDMENLFFQKIIDYNTFEYNPASNVKIGNKYEVDLLLNSYNIKKNPDILIEIKYLQNNLSIQLIRDAYKRLRQTFSFYVNSTKRNSKMILIVVYKSNIANEEEILRFLKANQDFEKEVNYHLFKLMVMSDDQAADYNIEQIIR